MRIATPEVAPRDGLLLAMEWCGICGTDRDEYESGSSIPVVFPHPLTGRTAPIVLGHEVCGRVIDVGANVVNFEAGQLVAVEGTISCGRCHNCLRAVPTLCTQRGNVGFSTDGGLAERLIVPAYTCAAVPDGIDPVCGPWRSHLVSPFGPCDAHTFTSGTTR